MLLSRGSDFSLPFVLFKFPFQVHVSVLIVFAAALAMAGVRILDLNVYHKMLRGAVTFGEDFEENYMKQIFALNKGMTQAISHFSRHGDAKKKLVGTKYEYIGKDEQNAEIKIRKFYNVTIGTLIGVAILLFVVGNLLTEPLKLTEPDQTQHTSLILRLKMDKLVAMRNNRIDLLICDLDNTLYDWVGFFVPSFYAMVEKAVEITKCDKEKLLDDFRKVHQEHHDSEHPFALLETDTIQEIFHDVDRRRIVEILDPALHAYNSMRKKTLKIHNFVTETLDELTKNNVSLVAHTESKLYAVVDRLRRFDLDSKFSRIYCRERSVSSHPYSPNADNWLESFPMNKVIELSKHQTKPNVEVLLEICSDEGVEPSRCAYVGDSIARDMLMAKRAGVYAIWAAYGANHDAKQYAQLVRISHWTEEDVQRELKLKEEARTLHPNFVAQESFADILKVFCINTKAVANRSVASYP